MLKKDEYNQDEYNDYYRQEAEGVDLKSSGGQGSGKSKLILLLVLIALAVAGFFGFKMLNSSKNTSDETTIEAPSNDVDENKVETIEAKNVETEVVSAIQKNIKSNDSMSAEEIAKVVALVMNQMKQQQNAQTTTVPTDGMKDDTTLMNALSGNSEDSTEEYEDMVTNTDIETKIKSDDDGEKLDTYNKVTLQNESGEEDALSKLSDQISNVLEENDETTTSTAPVSTYTQSIQQEVSTRSNEMRIIVVKKGDTLGKIAQRAYGNVMEYKKIYKANPEILNRPDRIYVGQKLRIPK